MPSEGSLQLVWGKKTCLCEGVTLTRNEDSLLSDLQLTRSFKGVCGGGWRKGTDPPGSVSAEVGMELGSEGLGRGRKKKGLFRAGKGENKVGVGDNDCEVFQEWGTDQIVSGQW